MLKYSDFTIWACVSILILIGFLMIFSSTYASEAREGGDAWFYVKKQFFALIVGIIGLAVFAYLDYSNLKGFAVASLYFASLLILMLVLYRGYTAFGAQRWFSVGPLSFQPSEISKLVVLLALADYLGSRADRIKGFINLIAPGCIVGLPFILIFRQPDLGTSLVLIAIFFGMLMWTNTSGVLLFLLVTPLLSVLLTRNIYLWVTYLAGIVIFLYLKRVKAVDSIFTVALNFGIGVLVPKLWGMLKAYQKRRLLAFINPEIDPLGAGYHTMQVKIAVGSGGFFGKGLFKGTQTQFSFIPQQFTDFIFSVGAEEFGFIGSFLLIFLFTLLIYRAVVIAGSARDFHGGLLAIGIAVMIGFHVFVNIGMTLGLLPVVGIPLPFLSFGGSALVINLIAIGILQSVCMRRQKILF